jgi:diguanylate cyclase (GGDEF)-like protein
MRHFISFPIKIMLLLLALLLLLSVSLTWLWLAKIDQELEFRQTEIQRQNHQQYALLNNMLKNRLEVWIESFVHQHIGQSNQLAVLSRDLGRELEFLQLHWQVNNLWLFDADKQILLTTNNETPHYLLSDIEQVLNSQNALFTYRCDEQCEQILISPILTGQGELAIISISTSLMDMLAFLNQSTSALVGQVKSYGQIKQTRPAELKIQGPMVSSQKLIIESLIAAIPAKVSMPQLIQNGFRLQLGRQYFLLDLLVLEELDSEQSFIILAHDISGQMKVYKGYQRRVILTAIVIFCLSGILFFWFTNRFRLRLMSLANNLPLLAQKSYQDFHQKINVVHKLWFSDEVDILQHSARQLAYRLEDLDSQIKERTAELEKVAMFDPLTGLANRNMLNYQLTKALANMVRRPELVAILFLDLDDFKKVNDSHGHSIGDKLLKQAAQRLMSLVRETDVVCRFGGDEFVLLMTINPELASVSRVAENLLEGFRDPLLVNEHRFYVSISIGIAVIDSADMSVDELVSQADVAMYEAKTAGGSCFRMFDSTMFHKVWNKVALESEAREALAHRQFGLALQPQIEIASGKLVGFEALLRWHHPQRGLIPPNDFIPILEGTEFMLSVGYWIIRHSFELLANLAAWGCGELKIAINLSAPQLLDPELIPLLEEQIASSGLSANLIEIELTERIFARDAASFMSIMQNLKSLGISLSIDDFGTGYSSLSYLKVMPADIIKIDASFIDGMLHSLADRYIVASTISLVKQLGMTLVAEGIEQREQLTLLGEFNCDIGQGYFIAKPIDEKHLREALQRYNNNGIWQNQGEVEQAPIS